MKLFIFGSTGDLVKRKIIPSLVQINKSGLNLELILLGRKDYNDESYSDFICNNCFKDFNVLPRYLSINLEEPVICKDCLTLLDKQNTNFFYIALHPDLLFPILKYISNIKKKGYKIKILSEKPFGSTYQNSILLKNTIINLDLKQDFYICDHYLYKPEIISLKNINFTDLKLIF
jgi:glucose-6-phosphate 1-dehydrogenase